MELGTNESPLPPFPEVQQAILAAATGLNRYPDGNSVDLNRALAKALGISEESIWFGAGSSELLTTVTRALGGPGRSVAYPWPSFVMYRVNSTLANAESVTSPLGDDMAIDLESLESAVRGDTTLVYLCNPNNPTGTYLTQTEVRSFVEKLPESTLVVVDEAYGEYVAAESHPTAIPLALDHPNVIVARTFSKIYGLAGLRIGYMVGVPGTLRQLRKAQIPFVVNSLAQTAAVTALRFPERIVERYEMNRQGVAYLETAFDERDIRFVPTQANFVWTRFGPGTPALVNALLKRGTIIRHGTEEWARVSVGSPEENRRFISDLDYIRERR